MLSENSFQTPPNNIAEFIPNETLKAINGINDMTQSKQFLILQVIPK